jgi:hypothetical protein
MDRDLLSDPHLVVDLSGHGFGHAGMTVPVLNALRYGMPKLRFTIRTTVPAGWLAERVEGPFDFVPQSDFGMAMADARRVLPDESFANYSRIHADWSEKIAVATEQLALLRPTLLLSNSTYFSLTAAKCIGVPAIAFGSLNWADIFHHYCIYFSGAHKILEQMVESYADAQSFLQTVPFMPMPSIRNGRAVGPVARMGRERKLELRRCLGLADDILLVLIALRGIPTKFSFSNWPRLNGMRVLAGPGQECLHPDVIPTATLNFPFIDIIRSCDVLITKPGYGLITEAACNGTPVLLLPWEDWPETLGLKEWLSRHGRMLMLTDKKLRDGNFLAEVREVLAMRAPLMPAPSGVTEIAEIIAAHLSLRARQ